MTAGRVRVRFHGELEDLLPAPRRGRWIDAPCAENATVKHTVEALDVPHTEVGDVFVDGAPASLDAPAHDGASIELHPARRVPAGPARFLADAHLGGLARRLRLLGFDCRFAGGEPDSEVARAADDEARIVLSRDRELLKHRRISRGRYVRATRTDDQVAEVMSVFGLRDSMRPLTRCLECNGELRPAARAEVATIVPRGVLDSQDEFVRCAACGRVYWPGTHLRRLRQLIEDAGR